MKWTNQRKAFGKPLHSQAVVRAKLAAMIARTESVQNWLENITYQMCNMVRRRRSFVLRAVGVFVLTSVQSYREQANKLAGYAVQNGDSGRES